VGGKGAGLMRLARQDLPVPDGFVVTASAFRDFLVAEGLTAELDRLATELDPADHAATEVAAGRVAALIEQRELPAELAAAIGAAYERLPQLEGQQPLVAVRSSATTEDSAEASFAGEYESFLGIRSADAVRENVRRCWASAFSGRSLAYMAKQGLAPADVAMAVVVQTMVPARASGVAFTLDPLTGDRLKIVIEGSWGLGLAVVGGEVTPDRFTLDKVSLRQVSAAIATKQREYRLTERGVDEQAVPAELADQPCLSEAELTALGELAKRIERLHGAPQDIEWAVAAGAPYLLQCRPITAWHGRDDGPPLAPEGNLLSWVTASLKHGVRAE
jgi:pyruvate,water dikinase